LDSCEGWWHGMASVYTILTCHDPGIQKERHANAAEQGSNELISVLAGEKATVDD
jgi:hypothetical protein